MATHQSNYLRTNDLKEQVSSLERQIRESVAGLAEVREQLLAAGRFEEDSGGLASIGVEDRRRESVEQAETRPVPLSELLGYASRISRFTVLRTKEEEGKKERQEGLQEDASKRTIKHEREDMEEGVLPDDDAEKHKSPSDSLEATAAGKSTKVEFSKIDGTALARIPGDDTGVGVAALTEAERNWQLQNTAALPFVPWPNDEMIRIGGLARVQSLLEKGKQLENQVGASRDDARGDGAAIQNESEEKQDLQKKESSDTNEYGMGISSRESRQKQEVKQRPAIFGGLDLYDPDEP